MESSGNSFTRIDHWVSAAEYAKRCNVLAPTIVSRIKRGVITATKINGFYVVDVEASPPIKKIGRQAPKAPSFVWPATMPPRQELVCARKFAHRKKVRADAFFKAVLFGKIPGWGVANHVLIRRADAESILKSS